MINRCFPLLGLVALGSMAQAQVSSFGISYYQDHVQVSEADPLPSTALSYIGVIYGTTLGDIAAGIVKPPVGPDRDLLYVTPIYLYDLGPSFTSLAALGAAYPAGNYRFSVTSGGSAGQFGVVNVPDLIFPGAVPRFTAGVYSSLINAPAGVDRVVSWAAYPYTGAHTNQINNITIYDETTATYSSGFSGVNPINTSYTIPGATLKSGHRYFIYLTFQAYSLGIAGFGSNNGSVSMLRRTLAYFNVKANPGTIAGDIDFENSGIFYNEPIEVKVKDANGNIENHTIVVGYNGYYAFDTALTGVVSISFKGDHFLTTVKTGVNTAVGQDNLDVFLRNGDCDGDDTVTTDDYLILNNAFDTEPGDANYDVRADLSDNGPVTTDDYLAFNQNFDVSGDVLP